DEDVLLPAVIDDVPDDEEVPGEIELLDERQLARDLRTRLVVIGAVPFARASLGDMAQKRHLCLAIGHRIGGKPGTRVPPWFFRCARRAPSCRQAPRADRQTAAPLPRAT